MKTITLRRAHTPDLGILQHIGKQTFYETFVETNTAENLNQYLETSFEAKKLEKELQNPDSHFYFALSDQQVVGYLKLNVGQAQTEIKDEKALEIERIYVLQAFHGKKIGQILYDLAWQIAQDLKVEYVWLGVWEHNEKAIKFYQKNGFVAFDKHIFVVGEDPQTDIMMKLAVR